MESKKILGVPKARKSLILLGFLRAKKRVSLLLRVSDYAVCIVEQSVGIMGQNTF